MELPNGIAVPYDIALLSENDPPLEASFEDVHYVDKTGASYELIVIDAPDVLRGLGTVNNDSLGPGGRLVKADSEYVILTDRGGIAQFGASRAFVPTIAGGGSQTKIEIVTIVSPGVV